jgi:hypothetical protein
MEPAIHEHHLVKYPGQLQRDLILINIMFCQIRQVIHSPSLYILHHKHLCRRRDYLVYVQQCTHVSEVVCRALHLFAQSAKFELRKPV